MAVTRSVFIFQDDIQKNSPLFIATYSLFVKGRKETVYRIDTVNGHETSTGCSSIE